MGDLSPKIARTKHFVLKLISFNSGQLQNSGQIQNNSDNVGMLISMNRVVSFWNLIPEQEK